MADREGFIESSERCGSHLKLKNYEDTIEFCNRALDIDRDNAKAHYRRGSAYFHSGQMDKAQKDLNRYLELNAVSASKARGNRFQNLSGNARQK